MPEYDYIDECGNVLTVRFPLAENKPAAIEHNGVTYRRLFTALPVIYNAMGFYKTDNLDSIEKWRKEHMKGM